MAVKTRDTCTHTIYGLLHDFPYTSTCASRGRCNNNVGGSTTTLFADKQWVQLKQVIMDTNNQENFHIYVIFIHT